MPLPSKEMVNVIQKLKKCAAACSLSIFHKNKKSWKLYPNYQLILKLSHLYAIHITYIINQNMPNHIQLFQVRIVPMEYKKRTVPDPVQLVIISLVVWMQA